MRASPASIAFVLLGLGAAAAPFAACSSETSSATTNTTDGVGGMLLATSSTTTSSAGGGGGGAGGAGVAGGCPDIGTGGAGGSIVNKAQDCAADDAFGGDDLTAPYGRLDGTLIAVLKTTDQQCAFPNHDHVVLEIMMHGSVYRAVVNVESDQGPPDVYYLQKQAPMPGEPWAEGWHTDHVLDYVNDLGVHSGDFTAIPLDPLSNTIVDRVVIGAPISVYSGTDGGDSSHLVHRNAPYGDGAIVVDPEGCSPLFLLFHFDEQVF